MILDQGSKQRRGRGAGSFDAKGLFGKAGKLAFQTEGAQEASRKALAVRGRHLRSIQRAAQHRQQKRRDNR